MANRFWVGGTGTLDGVDTTHWSATSGGAGGASVPTAADDVFLDGNSGAGTITVSSGTCKSLTCTGFTGTLNGGLTVAGSVTLSTGMTLTGGANLWTLNGTGSHTITSAGKSFPNSVTIAAGVGTYTLADAFTAANVAVTLTLTSGTFASANFSISVGLFSSSNSNTRTLTLGSSTVTITGTGTAWNTGTVTGLTMTANTATVVLSGAGPIFSSGTYNFQGMSLSFTGSGSAQLVTTGGTFANVTRTGTATKTDAFFVGTGGFTCTGTLALNSNSSVNRLSVTSTVTGTAVTITAAAVVISNVVDFSDITGAGAATWTVAGTGATLLGNAGGNSGITFTPAATQTWQGTAGGNWSDVTKWTSRVPLPQDNVVIASAFLATQTITTDMPRAGKDITWTGSTNAPRWTNSVTSTFYGSVALASSMSMLSATGDWIFGGRGTHTITSAGVSWGTNILRIIAPGATYTLADAFTLPQALVLTNGSLDTAGFAVSLLTFTSTGTGTRTLTLGTSTVSLTSTSGTVWNIASSGLTVSAASSTIALAVASASSRTFSGGNFTYGTLTYTVASSTGVLSMSGGMTIVTLNVSGGARTLTLAVSSATTVTNWNVFGLVGAVVTINSNTPGSAATISKSSGYLASDYVSVQDITGTGGATFYMGSRSTNVSGNTGLSFTDAPQRFWVGGTATWDATVGTKWAVVSGGTGGLAVPTTADDVYLDGNSGSGTVSLAASASVTCKNLVFTGYTGTFTMAASANVLVNGTAITLAATMTFTTGTGGALVINSASIVTLTSASKTIPGLTLNSAGGVTLADAVNVSGTLNHAQGTLNTASFAVTCGTFSSNNSNTRTLTLGSSSVTVTGGSGSNVWNTTTATGLTLNAGTSTVTFTGASANYGGGGASAALNNVVATGTSFVVAGTSTCANFTVTGGAIKGDSLTLSANLTVTGTLTLNSNSSTNRLIVKTNATGTTRTLTAAAVAVSNVVDFTDVTAAGAAAWTVAGTGATALGDALGNSGITFTPATTRYGVVAGNWSSTATWSTVSGGAGGASVPLPQDTVILDASSAAGTYTRDMPRLCRDLTCTGFTRTLTASVAHTIYGSITLASGMTHGSGGFSTTVAGRNTHTLTSAGQGWTGGFLQNGPGGTYTLQDAFSATNAFLTVQNGTLNTGSFSYTGTTFTVANIGTAGVVAGTTTFTLTATSGTVWNIQGTLPSVSAASATIVLSVASASSRNFVGGGFSYGTLTYTVAASPGALVVTGANTFGTLNVGSGRTLTLPSSTTTTVTNWNVVGTAGNVVTVNSSTAGTAATLSKTTGSVISGYLSIQDITATGGATWYAGATSTNVSGNTGWIFTDMPVDVTRSTSWAVKAAVTQTRSTSWPVRALATASRQTSWNTRAAVSATRSTSWAVRVTAAASRSTRWQVTSVVTASRASSWSVRAAVTASRQSAWSVAQVVTKATGTSWAVTSAVTKATSTSWQLTSRIDASRATGWAVTAAVDASAGTSWAVRVAVPTASRRTGWSVAQLAARSCATRWALTSRVDNSCATGWSVAQAVRADRTTSWGVRTKADASRLARWRVRHGHGRNITAYAGPPRSGWYAGEPASGWSAQEPKSGWHAREPVE